MNRVAYLLAACLLALPACSRDNPASGQVTCLERCGEDYSAQIEVCLDLFWDDDKRTCSDRAKAAFQLCQQRCKEDAN